ncbi:MAG: methyltransferase domain-containing protein [Candidatus Dechloromonas phosphoritropha]
MHDGEQAFAIQFWLAEVRSQFVNAAPELLPLLDTYSAEALFGRRYIDSDLDSLQSGARILEVGAGSLLLSCQLMREGFEVTALEPIGDGFSHFDQMRQIVMDKARSLGCCPAILDRPAEVLATVNHFDYAFSVNVMEHVDDVARVLENVGKSLTFGASYRFTCPNYLFPYEPHFNIPTFFSKQLTERLLGRMIFGSRTAPDPSGTWKSLNWINVIRVGKYVRRFSGLKLTFNRSMLVSTLERIASDPDFAGRRSPAMRSFLLMLVRLRIHQLFWLVPAVLQPIMDCRVERTADPEVC